MFDEDGGSEETETPGGSLDPIAVATAAAGLFEHHPLFPREDGSPETRDIQFVSFCRKRTGDQAMQNCPEDIPAHEVKSWAQVVEWWGGGEYKAIAKNGKHRMVAWFPNTGGEWLIFDGDSKPFTLRNGKGYRAPGPTGSHPSADAPPSAPAPVAQEDLRGMLKEVLQELRNPRVVPPPAAPANDGALVAMIQAQAAQATATSQANTQMMQTLLTAVAQRPAENAARPAEPTTLALQLIGAVQKLVPAPVAQPGLAEQLPVIKALRDLYQPAAVAPTNELQPFVDIFGQVMAADAASKQAEAARAQTTSKPQDPPAPRPPPRPRPELVHVPGLGMVEVVAPDMGARRFGEASTEERAAAIRNDPALLRELGIGLSPAAVTPTAPAAPAPPSPTSPASPVAHAVVATVPAIPAVPDLEPTPVAVVVAAPPVASSTMSPAPSVVATASPKPETVAAPSPVAPAPPVVVAAAPVALAAPAAPSVVRAASPVSPPPPVAPSVVATRGELPPDAPEEERPPIALPERMPVIEPPHAAEPERERAMGELKRLTSLPHEQRVAALRKLPGIGPMADDVARAMGSLPPEALMAMAQTLDVDAIGALAGRANGAAGG